MLGGPLLGWNGRQWARRLAPQGVRVVVNGGNCPWPDINWVHCVHHAYPSPDTGGLVRRARTRALHSLNRAEERTAIRMARVVVCNSRRTANDVVRYLGIDPELIRVVYLGIDPDRFPPIVPDERAAARDRLGWVDRPWVGFVGQLGNRVKGFDTLYEAWRMLCADPRWDANLAVVGTGANPSRWLARADADGLAGRVCFLGYRTDVPETLAGCDAMVHPARYDAFGMAVQEAVCRGLPVVVSSAAGVSELYPPELSDLVLPDAEDVGGLVDRLRAWRRDLDAWSGRCAPLAAAFRAHTWDDMARDFVAAVSGVAPLAPRPASRTVI